MSGYFQLNLELKTLFKILVCTGFFYSCSSNEFTGGAGAVNKPPVEVKPECDKATDPSCGTPTPPPVVTTTESELQKHKAVFAVRNVSCTLCHATVESNIISDMAVSTNPTSAAVAFASLMHVAQSKGAAKKTTISGDFIYPKSDLNVFSSSMTGATTNCSNTGPNQNETALSKIDLGTALKTCFDAKVTWGPTSQHFVEKQKVAINPVNDPATIKAIALDKALLESQGYAPAKDANITGVTGAKTSGFTLTGAISCEGAIVFDAPVLLKNVAITSEKGCRIYATRSILVFGGASVSGAKSSLQLMSTIYVGIDISLARINKRFAANFNWVKRFDYSIGNADQVVDLIRRDINSLGAGSIGGDGKIDYSRIAMSAPVVFSHTKGVISGIIVAEFFLGPVGSTKFKFESAFTEGEGISIFPEIKQPIVVVE